jgi:hypothetical protein
MNSLKIQAFPKCKIIDSVASEASKRFNFLGENGLKEPKKSHKSDILIYNISKHPQILRYYIISISRLKN